MLVQQNSKANSGDIMRQIAVVVATVVTLTVNALANALPINGQTTAQISDRFPVFFVPAGYVFAIWGLIYLGLIAFTIYHSLPSQKTNPALRKIGWLYVLSGAANIAWIFAWHYELFLLTILLMLSLLGLLIAIYLRLDIHGQDAAPLERWIVRLPFSIYLGWITVATIANATDVLYWAGWDGLGISGEVWAAALLVVATVIAGVVSITRRDIAYSAVLVWAFVGIVMKQSGAPLVATTAGAMAAVVVLVLALSLLLGSSRRLRLKTGPA